MFTAWRNAQHALFTNGSAADWQSRQQECNVEYAHNTIVIVSRRTGKTTIQRRVQRPRRLNLPKPRQTNGVAGHHRPEKNRVSSLADLSVNLTAHQ